MLLFAVAAPPATLRAAIEEAVRPVLRNRSLATNQSAWSFAYHDAVLDLTLCEGYTDRERRAPCDPAGGDLFFWGSTTKPMSSVLALQLVEQGRIASLDDPFLRYAEPFVRRTFNASLQALYDARIADVTIRHLLQHYSGISEYDSPRVRAFSNAHRGLDLDPLWVVRNSNRTFICDPGTCGKYSSTNYVLLGLVLAEVTGAAAWDRLDQRRWIPPALPLDSVRYAVHGPCRNFSTATGRRAGSVPGYQPVCPRHRHACVTAAQSDVSSMSSTQGWTCGNLAARPLDVARFFWALLAPNASQPLLTKASLDEMMRTRWAPFLGRSTPFAYGLGVGGPLLRGHSPSLTRTPCAAHELYLDGLGLSGRRRVLGAQRLDVRLWRAERVQLRARL